MPPIELEITPETNIKELVARLPIAAQVMNAFGLGCSGCSVSKYETIEQGAASARFAHRADRRGPQAAGRSGSVPSIAEDDRRPARRAPGAFAGYAKIAHIDSRHVRQRRRRQIAGHGAARDRPASRALRVGILDADITGPSIPQALRLARTARDRRPIRQDDAARSAAAAHDAGRHAQRDRGRQLEPAHRAGRHRDDLARSDRRRRDPAVLRTSAVERSRLLARSIFRPERPTRR